MNSETTTQLKSVDNMRVFMIHKRQSNALVGGLFPLMAYGFFFVWSIYIPNERYSIEIIDQLIHATVAFFVGMIVGAVIGHFLIGKYRKIVIYFIINILTIVSGICLIPEWCIWISILSRYIGGLALGIALLTTLIHASEIATNDMRGAVIAVISVLIAATTFTATTILSTEAPITSPSSPLVNQIFGTIIIIFGTFGLLFTRCFFLESPVYLIRNNQDAEALETMKRARLNTQESPELHRDFQELKDYVHDEKSQEDSNSGRDIFLQVLFLRLIYTVSTSLMVVRCLFDFSQNLTVISAYGYFVMMIGRLVAELIVLYWIEKIGRKKLLILSNCACGVILLISAFTVLGGGHSTFTIVIIVALGIFYQIAIGLGMGPVTLVYTAELFSPKRKSISIMGILVIENLLQILLIVIDIYLNISAAGLFILLGGLQGCVGMYFCNRLPETKGATLRECLRFEK